MATEPNSYGTGRDPRQTGNHLLPILILLLSCVAIHGMTHLYLSLQSLPEDSTDWDLHLDDLPSDNRITLPLIQDNCGLGLELSDISEIQQRYWSLPDGVFIEQIEPDSAAYLAGLRSGDLLVQIEDHIISDAEECLDLFRAYADNEELELVYFRDGVERSLRIALPDCDGES